MRVSRLIVTIVCGFSFVIACAPAEESADPEFRQACYRPAQLLDEGRWGRRFRIFFDAFYGEAIEIAPGRGWARPADDRPMAGLLWAGCGTVNGGSLSIDRPHRREFLLAPRHPLELVNQGSSPLIVYTVFPMTAGSPG